MLKKSKLILLGIICATLIPVGVTAGIQSTDKTVEKSILDKYVNKNETEVKLTLKQLGKNQLIDEINFISTSTSTSTGYDGLQNHATELFSRKNEFENQEVIKNIENNINSEMTQEVMVDLYTIKNEDKSSKDELKNLLKGNLRKQVKSKIVASAIFTELDVDLLKGLIEQDDDQLTFQSLKALSKVNSKESYVISQNILSNYKSQSTPKVSAAQKATLRYLKDTRIPNKDKLVNKDKFIDLCSQIIDTTQDSTLKDSSIFALANLNDKESIIKIIQNNFIDRELKVLSVDKNFFILKEILLNNPSEADIKDVISAMEILPILDLIEPLKNVKANINNKILEKRCDDVLVSMKLNGRKGNVQWLD